MNVEKEYSSYFSNGAYKKASEVPPYLAPEASISKEELLELLQQDLALEYKAALQYLQHYAVLKGAEYDFIREHLKEHADEEIEHSVMIAGRIAYMGGTPRVTFETILTSDDSRKMLGQDLQGEQEAIRRYKERILQAMSLGEFGLADVLKDILEDEEEHEDDLITSLGADTAAGEDPGILSEGPGGAASYISEDPQVKELQDLREKRKEVIIQKLASLKKS